MDEARQIELIKRAQEGDKEAFEALFRVYKDRILKFLYRYMGGDFQAAEDVTVETFLEVYKGLPLYKEQGQFSSWVYKIAINLARTAFKKRKRRKEVSADLWGDEGASSAITKQMADDRYRPDSNLPSDERVELIKKIITKLDEKYKNVLLLCDVQGFSYEEAATILGCKKMTVGVRLQRARKLCCDALERYGYTFKGQKDEE